MSSKLEYRNHIIIPDKDNFINLLPKLAFHIEYKVNNTSIYPIYCLNQEANKHGYKVALTGEGAGDMPPPLAFTREPHSGQNSESLGISSPQDSHCMVTARLDEERLLH